MKFEIKSWLTGGVLFSCETESMKLAVGLAIKAKADLRSADLRSADLSSADLRSADLSSADLRSADLSSADLRSADLRYADLRYANLRSADLRYADLRYANLRSAENLNKLITTPLYLLLDQPGKIRAYKLVKENGDGPFNGGIIYEVGKTYLVVDADTDEKRSRGKGINLATLDWCLREWKSGYRILIAEFTAKDIAAIPVGSDGKFRVRKCKIVGEKKLKDCGMKEAK